MSMQPLVNLVSISLSLHAQYQYGLKQYTIHVLRFDSIAKMINEYQYLKKEEEDYNENSSVIN